MTKALFKKQIMEVFSWLYQDKKTGKKRNANSLIGCVLLYLLLFGFLCVMFSLLAKTLCKPLLAANMGWLYWCLTGMLAIFFGVFGSVFNTYSSLYQAKDNDMLLSMPIPTSRILMVRLFGVYTMGLVYELIVMLPTMVIWFINAPFSIIGTINVILIPLVASLLILVLSAILGWVVAVIATRVKYKNIVTVVVSLAFMSIYYYFYSKAYAFLQALLMHLGTVGHTLKAALYPLYHMGKAAEGSVTSMLIFTAIILAATAITYWILSRSFINLAISNNGNVKVVYKEQMIKLTPVRKALLRKELRRFIGNANYILNCGLGTVLMPVGAIFLIWKSSTLQIYLTLPPIQPYIPLGAAGIVCLLSSMNIMSAPSVSLEGKNLWIVQSLPVTSKQILLAKLEMHLLLTWIPAIPLVLVLEWITKPNLLSAIFLVLVPALFMFFMAVIGLVLNLKMPNLHWTSEAVPIKQSTPVMASLFGGWLLVAAFGGLFFLLRKYISASVYFALIGVLLFVISAYLYRWLLTKGCKIFETL